jgi:hypothetical protein
VRRFLACAVVGLVVVGIAAADGQISFVDPTGDAGSSIDLTGLRITSYPQGGGIEVEATVIPNRFWCRGEGGDLPLLVAIDTDQNPDTGSAFYGTEIEFAFSPPTEARDGEPVFRRASGWNFRGARLASYGWECGPGVGGYYVDTPALGMTATSGFNVVAATVSSHPDTAPDIGTFNVQRVAGTPPPKLGPDRRAPHVLTYSAVGVHGKVVALSYQALDGRGKTADTIRIYRGKQLLKTIRRPLHDSNPFKLAEVSWRVPHALRGRLRFSVRSADAAGNESNLGWAWLTIH